MPDPDPVSKGYGWGDYPLGYVLAGREDVHPAGAPPWIPVFTGKMMGWHPGPPATVIPDSDRGSSPMSPLALPLSP